MGRMVVCEVPLGFFQFPSRKGKNGFTDILI